MLCLSVEASATIPNRQLPPTTAQSDLRATAQLRLVKLGSALMPLPVATVVPTVQINYKLQVFGPNLEIFTLFKVFLESSSAANRPPDECTCNACAMHVRCKKSHFDQRSGEQSWKDATSSNGSVNGESPRARRYLHSTNPMITIESSRETPIR